MAININNLNNSNQVQLNRNNADVKQQAAQVATSTTQVKRANQDSVSITPKAKQLGELQK